METPPLSPRRRFSSKAWAPPRSGEHNRRRHRAPGRGSERPGLLLTRGLVQRGQAERGRPPQGPSQAWPCLALRASTSPRQASCLQASPRCLPQTGWPHSSTKGQRTWSLFPAPPPGPALNCTDALGAESWAGCWYAEWGGEHMGTWHLQADVLRARLPRPSVTGVAAFSSPLYTLLLADPEVTPFILGSGLTLWGWGWTSLPGGLPGPRQPRRPSSGHNNDHSDSQSPHLSPFAGKTGTSQEPMS